MDYYFFVRILFYFTISSNYNKNRLLLLIETFLFIHPVIFAFFNPYFNIKSYNYD